MKTFTQSAAIYVLLLSLLAGLSFTACGSGSSGGSPVVVAENLWYLDQDNDDFGDIAISQNASDAPDGYVDNGFDCDDSNSAINPMLKNCPGFEDVTGIIPDTTQTASYTNTYGEDNDYLINPPSYTKLDEIGNDLPDSTQAWQMVRDNVTGLIWELKNGEDSAINLANIHDADNAYTWEEANANFVNALNEVSFGNFTDSHQWRLPTVRELSLIVNSSKYHHAVTDSYFPAEAYTIWTATPSVSSSSAAFCFSTMEGTFVETEKTTKFMAWAVRDTEQSLNTSSSFKDLGSGIIQDTTTGLMWQQTTDAGENGYGYTFDKALEYCNNLTLSGFTDWRLPSRNELITLIDFERTKPALQPDLFTNISHSNYWSSTSYDLVGSGLGYNNPHFLAAWTINLYSPSVTDKYKLNACFVKAVRGGKTTNLTTWYRDNDEDEYGDPAVSIQINATLPQPTGYVSNKGDCNDTTPDINPTVSEIADDGIDQDCSGSDLFIWYADNDGDGYGSESDTTFKETQPEGYVRNIDQVDDYKFDSNDLNISINPDMDELLADGLDNNSDGKQSSYWYIDSDNDGYGTGLALGSGENPPDEVSFYATNDIDCNDNEPSIHPGLVGSDGCINDIDALKIIPDTGQTITYTTIGGEDGDYLINPPSFTKIDSSGIDLADSVIDWTAVRDNVTGLYWEAKTDDNKAKTYTYATAQAYIDALNTNGYVGFSDWRLPTLTELAMIANLDNSSTAINQDYFSNVQPGRYWTESESGTSNKIVISFIYGQSYTVSNTDSNVFVMAVRGWKSHPMLLKNADGTVTEQDSGLVWNGISWHYSNWSNSIEAWNALDLCGYSDWHLPTEEEVSSLFDILAKDPSLNLEDYFTIRPIYETFWSYTLSSTNSTQAFKYNTTTKQMQTESIGTIHYSLGVRGTRLPRFIDNGDGTVFDSKTGLMWMKEDGDSSTKMHFEDALSYCETMNTTGFAAYTDWRIPSRNELLSLLDAAIINRDDYIKAFPSSGSLYWTSSSSSVLPNTAWQIDFTDNSWEISLGGYTTQSNAFRAVRGGN